MKYVQICTDFIFCIFLKSLHVTLIVVSIYICSKSKLPLHLRVRPKLESVCLNDYAHGYPIRSGCTDQLRILGERFSDTVKLYLKIMMAGVNYIFLGLIRVFYEWLLCQRHNNRN